MNVAHQIQKNLFTRRLRRCFYVWNGISLLLCLAAAPRCRAQEVTIAAAADLRPALDVMTKRFEPASGIHLRVIYGSSGELFQQIKNGAPMDVFLSANSSYARTLEQNGEATAGSYYEYARGKIVLAVVKDSKLDVTRGLSVLPDPEVRKIAIADPAHAPYGQAAVSALKTEKLYDKVSSKLVTGENISQATSFVLSGAADAGIVALSLVIAPPARAQVRYAEIPDGEYPPIVQACVIVRSAKNQIAATNFEAYLQSDEARTILRNFGFEAPAQKPVQ
jgi:molybdate transport system substrate-binding protein